MKIQFLIKLTSGKNAGSFIEINRKLKQYEPIPREGDIVIFNSDDLKDLEIMVQDCTYKYNKDDELNSVLIYCCEVSEEDINRELSL